MKLKYLLGPVGFFINNKKIQEKTEEIAYGINYKLGEVVSKANAISRKEEEVVENTVHTISNYVDRQNPVSSIYRRFLAPEVVDLSIGDHLFVQRSVYTHHGLYYGDGKVIHYLMESITIDTLETFADGSKILKKSKLYSPTKYSKNEIINRAKSRLRENKYNLIINNCEHFVRWCRNDGPK